MNVFLLTDLEGVPGITSIDFMDRGGEKYVVARDALCCCINLVVAACFDFGADNVYYLDGHGGGGNVYEEKIDPRAKKCDISMWQTLLQQGKIDCQIEVGAHARAGTIGGFLDHTISSKSWFSHRVNGILMSELSMHALVCGAFDVPIVACIGDEAACEQAKEYIPEIFVGAVKKATTRNVAADYENTDKIIIDTVKNALRNYKSVPPYKAAEPSTIELTLYRTDMCEALLDATLDKNVERVDARTLRKTVEKIKSYSDLKF